MEEIVELPEEVFALVDEVVVLDDGVVVLVDDNRVARRSERISELLASWAYGYRLYMDLVRVGWNTGDY